MQISMVKSPKNKRAPVEIEMSPNQMLDDTDIIAISEKSFDNEDDAGVFFSLERMTRDSGDAA
jgi:hypothetical protein